MTGYRLEPESDGNLGIYHIAEGSATEVWVGNILEPDSPNPALVLGIPVGILGVQKILDLFKKWKAEGRSANGKRRPSARSVRRRAGTRKWRNTYRAGK